MDIDDDEYEIDDTPCPKCGHHTTRSRTCDEVGCDDGYIDEHDEDPINFAPGQAYEVCQECRGTGHVRWCPKCGCDLNQFKATQQKGGDDEQR